MRRCTDLDVAKDAFNEESGENGATKKDWTKDNVVMVAGERTDTCTTNDDMSSKDDEVGSVRFQKKSFDVEGGVFDKDDPCVVTEDQDFMFGMGRPQHLLATRHIQQRPQRPHERLKHISFPTLMQDHFFQAAKDLSGTNCFIICALSEFPFANQGGAVAQALWPLGQVTALFTGGCQ